MNHTPFVSGLAFVNKMVLDFREEFKKMNNILFDPNLLDLVANQMSVSDVEAVLNTAYDNAEDTLIEMFDNNQVTPEIREDVMFELELVEYFKVTIEAVA